MLCYKIIRLMLNGGLAIRRTIRPSELKYYISKNVWRVIRARVCNLQHTFDRRLYPWLLRTRKASVEAVIRRNTICWDTANYSVARSPFCPPSWNLLFDLCQTSTNEVRCHYAQFSEKNEVSILITGWVTVNYNVSRSSFFPQSWNL